MGWTDKGNGNRTLATTIPKAGINNYIYGDDAHTDAVSSELAFAGIENGTNFQNTFEFEAPEWITGISAVENSNSIDNQKYYNLKFNVASNGEGQPARSGNIVIKYHEQSLTLTVNQEAGETATGFTLYMNSDSNYSDTLAAIKVNGSSITPPTTKSIKIFTSATPPSTNPGKITIEIQPSNPSGTSKTFYLSFNTSTSYNNDNIVYNNFSGEPSPLPNGLSAFQYLTSNNTVQIKVDNNNLIWEDMVDDVSCGQRFYEPADNIYPTINILISNKLLSVSWYVQYIIKNESPFTVEYVEFQFMEPSINSGNRIETHYTLYPQGSPDGESAESGSVLMSMSANQVNNLFELSGENGIVHKEIDATGEAGNLAARVSQYTYINNKDDTMIITLYQL